MRMDPFGFVCLNTVSEHSAPKIQTFYQIEIMALIEIRTMNE